MAGRAAGGAASWVMIGGGLLGVIGDTTAASVGYATISRWGSSSSNGTPPLELLLPPPLEVVPLS